MTRSQAGSAGLPTGGPRATHSSRRPSPSCSNHVARGADATRGRSEGCRSSQCAREQDRAALEPGQCPPASTVPGATEGHGDKAEIGLPLPAKAWPSGGALAGRPHPPPGLRGAPRRTRKRCPMGRLRRLCRESSPRPGLRSERPARPGAPSPDVTAQTHPPRRTAP